MLVDINGDMRYRSVKLRRGVDIMRESELRILAPLDIGIGGFGFFILCSVESCHNATTTAIGYKKHIVTEAWKEDRALMQGKIDAITKASD